MSRKIKQDMVSLLLFLNTSHHYHHQTLELECTQHLLHPTEGGFVATVQNNCWLQQRFN